MPEFRKLLDLQAVRLDRTDIDQLGRLMRDGVASKEDYDEYSLSSGDVTYRSSSIDELMAQDLPQIIDGLHFRVSGRRDHDIIQSVSVDLGQGRASCWISSSDEIWFRGKIQQITDFFVQHPPWYGKIKREKIPRLSGFLDGIFIVCVVGFITLGLHLPATIALVVVISSSIAFRAFQKGRLFPVTDIQILQRPRHLTREVLMVIFTGMMAVASVATAIMQTVKP